MSLAAITTTRRTDLFSPMRAAWSFSIKSHPLQYYCLLLFCLSATTVPLKLPAQILPGDTGPLHLEIIPPEQHGGAPLSSKITEDSRGNIYVANQIGTLRFDGVNWQQLPETGYNNFTSAIHIDDAGKIWIGGFRHVGYYEPDATGQLTFTDRTQGMIKELAGKEIGTIWDIFSDKNRTYVITSFQVVCWNGHDWQHHDFDVERRILPSWLNGKLYIHARKDGLYEFTDDHFEKVLDESPEISSGIIRVLYAENGTYRFATVNNGMSELETGSGESEFRPLNKDDESQYVYAAIPLRDGTTALGGADFIRVVDTNGKSNTWKDNQLGLIYHLHESADGSLWAGTTKCIVRIPPIRYSKIPLESHNLARHGGTLFSSNNNHLNRIRIDGSDAEIEIVASGALSYGFLSKDRYLIFSNHLEMIILNNGHQYKSLSIPRSYGQFYESRYHKGVFYSLELPEVSRWKIDQSGLSRLNQTLDSKLLIGSIVDISAGESLISTTDYRMGRLSWPALNAVGEPPELEIFESVGGLPERLTAFRLLSVGKRAVLASNEGFFIYETNRHVFRPIEALSNPINDIWSGLALCPTADGEGVVIYTKDNTHSAGYRLGVLRLDGAGKPLWRSLRLPGISGAGTVLSLLHELRDGHEILWVGGSKGLLRYDLDHIEAAPAPQVNLTSITENTENTTLYGGFGPLPGKTAWSYPQRSLRINYAAPPAALKAQGYQTRLAGFADSWTELTELPFREFNNLNEGEYLFEVRAIDEFGRHGPSTSFGFTILPPWYRTSYAYLGYVALVIAVFIIIIRLWTRRLHQRNIELEAAVNQRTGELERRNQQLLEANAVKQNFLASMSHEIRNPLNGILGIAHLLKQEQTTNSTRISHLNTCATHLHQLLGQVLDFSSLESGKLETRPLPFDPNRLIQEVIGMHQVLAEKKGLSIKLSTQRTDHLWIGDSVLLRQVLINLVSNAIKYTASGEVRMRMAFENQNQSIRAQFIVEDSGPGIPEDKQEYIFKEFTRLCKAGESEVGGTGLGLAIAKQMAERMQGTLRLDSGYTHGARFVLELPFDTGGKIIENKSSERKGDHQPLRGKHVLVADDMDFNRYICRELLETLGARVTEAEDGQLALEALNQHSFEIAILDINMPILDGNQVVRRFLDGQVGPPLLFVALTAHVTARMEKEALDAGFQHFIEKPLDPEQIMQIALAQPLREKKAKAPDLLSYLAGNDEGSRFRLQTRYLESMREQIEVLRSCIDRNDGKAAKAALHKIRGLANMQRNAGVIDMIDRLSNSLSDGGAFDSAAEHLRLLEASLKID